MSRATVTVLRLSKRKRMPIEHSSLACTCISATVINTLSWRKLSPRLRIVPGRVLGRLVGAGVLVRVGPDGGSVGDGALVGVGGSGVGEGSLISDSSSVGVTCAASRAGLDGAELATTVP